MEDQLKQEESKPKLIGIVGWSSGETSFGAGKAYLEYLKNFGDVIILGPGTHTNLDLLVLPGGKDVVRGNPDYSFYQGAPEQFLEHFDHYTLPKYIKDKTPILGICRGFQTLARHFGIPIEANLDLSVHGYSENETKTSVHTLIINDKYKNFAAPNNNKEYRDYNSQNVGSWHHQGVEVRNLNSQFRLIGSTKDGIVEYVEHPELPIVGIQSHPERNQTYLDDYLITELLKRK